MRLRGLAAVVALIGWAALVLQFYLLVRLTVTDGRGAGAGIGDFFGYFTILTNILAALTLSAPLLVRDSSLGRFFARPGVITAVAAAIALVGVAYSLLLREVWDPQGWQLVADAALHDVIPLLFLIYWWLAVPKDAIRFADIPSWYSYPICYLVYALVRGALTGRYAYHFIDVDALGYGRVLANAMGLVLVFTGIAVVLVGASALKKDTPLTRAK